MANFTRVVISPACLSQAPTGRSVQVMGLNLPTMASALREAVFPKEASGAAQVRWPKDAALPDGGNDKAICSMDCRKANPSLGFSGSDRDSRQPFVRTL